MAIINCPECGWQVSDKAKTCIHCGAPLKGIDQVAIKLVFFNNTSIGGRARACDMQVATPTEVLWCGKAGTTAIFTLKEATWLKFNVAHCYTGFFTYSDFSFTCFVEPGKKYQMRCLEQAFIDPTQATYGLTEVDIIDSE